MAQGRRGNLCDSMESTVFSTDLKISSWHFRGLCTADRSCGIRAIPAPRFGFPGTIIFRTGSPASSGGTFPGFWRRCRKNPRSVSMRHFSESARCLKAESFIFRLRIRETANSGIGLDTKPGIRIFLTDRTYAKKRIQFLLGRPSRFFPAVKIRCISIEPPRHSGSKSAPERSGRIFRCVRAT